MLLVRFLQTTYPDIIAHGITSILCYLIRVYLADITEHIGRVVYIIFS